MEKGKVPYRDEVWEHSTLGNIGNRVIGNDHECFECHKCGTEFRQDHCVPNYPCRRDSCCVCSGSPCGASTCTTCIRARRGIPCSDGSCPSCGSIYVEWLSYDTCSKAIYLRSEHDNVVLAWLGSVERGPFQ